MSGPQGEQLDQASRVAVDRLVAAFKSRLLEFATAGGTGEVCAVAVLQDGRVTQKSHLVGPREYPLKVR